MMHIITASKQPMPRKLTVFARAQITSIAYASYDSCTATTQLEWLNAAGCGVQTMRALAAVHESACF